MLHSTFLTPLNMLDKILKNIFKDEDHELPFRYNNIPIKLTWQ